MTPVVDAAVPAAAPGIARRFACMMYEGVLLFGIVVVVGLFYAGFTQQQHALRGRAGLLASLFVVIALYFTWFWSRHGQTLAMRTWHIRLVTSDGHPVPMLRALLRFLASLLWFLPALAVAHRSGLDKASPWLVGLTLALWMLLYGGLALLRPDRQFWHDVLCGTRLVTWRPPPKAESAK